jgi:hypothetical protein
VVAALAAWCGGLAGASAARAADAVPLRAAPGLAFAAGRPLAAGLPGDFSGEAASAASPELIGWETRSGDTHGLPFMIVDKTHARLCLFTATGALAGAAPVLLGLGHGDDSPPGIGDRPLAAIRPADRITPAGRFEATMGVNLAGQDILWVDYQAALSVHRAADPKHGLTAKGRLARLASATVADNRISHGCVNVSEAFFDEVLRPAFAETAGIVYILPETRSLHDQFSIRGRSATHRPNGERVS